MSSNPYEVKTTQIDSTKKMGNSLLDRFPFVDILEWKKGMRFIIPSPQEPFLNEVIQLAPYGDKNGKYGFLKQTDLQWKVIEFDGIEYRNAGKEQVYVIFNIEDSKFEHPATVSPTIFKIPERGYNVPMLHYLDEIDAAKQELVGREMYILNRMWRQDKPGGGSKAVSKARKFIRVIILNVGVGTSPGQVKVLFSEKGSDVDYFTEVLMSGTNSLVRQSTPRLDTVFSLEDPRQNYPAVDSAVWEKIQVGDVKVGMTTQECELSWAKPRKVNNVIFDGIDYELWDFGNELLLFKNDKLDLVKSGTDRFGIRIVT